METLESILQAKKANPTLAHDVVTEAAQWLQIELNSSNVDYRFADCEKDYCGYATFQIHSVHQGTAITLYLKIAEVKTTPYVFADIRIRNNTDRVLFPFFGEIGSDDGREIMLNYIADFLLSME